MKGKIVISLAMLIVFLSLFSCNFRYIGHTVFDNPYDKNGTYQGDSTTTIGGTTTTVKTTTTTFPGTTTTIATTTTTFLGSTTTTISGTTTTTIGGTTTTVDPATKIGNTWTTVCSLGTETYISVIKYMSDGNFYAGTESNFLYKSSDGTNWTYITQLATSKYKNGIQTLFDAGNSRFIAGTRDDWGRLMKSENYGSNWTEIGKWYSWDYPALYITGIIRCNNGVLFTNSGGDPNASQSWKSTDNGEIWSVFIAKGSFQEQYFSYAGDNHVNLGLKIKYGTSEVRHSVDNGLNWTTTKSISYPDYSVIPVFLSIQNEIAGKVILLAGKDIYISNDYGQTWSGSKYTSTNILYTPNYLGNGKIIIQTLGGNLLRSSDYGETWNDLGVIGDATAIKSFLNLNNGYAVLSTHPNGRIYRTADYGETWSLITQYNKIVQLLEYRETPTPIILGNIYDTSNPRVNPAIIIKSVE